MLPLLPLFQVNGFGKNKRLRFDECRADVERDGGRERAEREGEVVVGYGEGEEDCVEEGELVEKAEEGVQARDGGVRGVVRGEEEGDVG